MRNNYSHIFINRDPNDKGIQSILHVTDMLPLPQSTKDNYKILFYRLADFDPDKFNFTDAIKAFFIVADVRLNTLDPNGISDGEIPIFDMNGFSLRHMTKTVLSVLRIYMKYTQEAHPVRLKQIHVINCSSFLDRALSIVRPFMKNEVFKLIHFHLPDSETLYEFIPKDLLPNEYGGIAGEIKTIKADILENIEKNRDYLMDASRWKIDETKRVNNNNSSSDKQNKGVSENFRSLSID